MRQLLELSGAAPTSPGSVISGHQSPAPTPSTTNFHPTPQTKPLQFKLAHDKKTHFFLYLNILARSQRQIDINPAEFSKYKLEKPGI